MSLFLTSSPPRSIPYQFFLEVPDLFRSQRSHIFWPFRFPSHESLFPVVKILNPGRGCVLFRASESSRTNLGWASSLGDDGEEEDGLCPVNCVKEFKTEEEFSRILEKAKETNSLVVVDFYRTSCGSCKYIEQGFAKLCKGSGADQDSVVFLKHNVLDEYDEQSEVAERLRIKRRWWRWRISSKDVKIRYQHLVLAEDDRLRRCRYSSSTRMGFFWNHLQPETKRGS